MGRTKRREKGFTESDSPFPMMVMKQLMIKTMICAVRDDDGGDDDSVVLVVVCDAVVRRSHDLTLTLTSSLSPTTSDVECDVDDGVCVLWMFRSRCGTYRGPVNDVHGDVLQPL